VRAWGGPQRVAPCLSLDPTGAGGLASTPSYTPPTCVAIAHVQACPAQLA
jgi:hypothetical protein